MTTALQIPAWLVWITRPGDPQVSVLLAVVVCGGLVAWWLARQSKSSGGDSRAL